ncbi:hypothetical protein GH714_035038 [Hevea brasiliensis]|uniref:Protein kinase domain-containing protein n=1 Tax=Hevea brasiliensis TaxID=3981 RepID=A0A6A6MFU7_HEVBR|nr:hypothetical protein GH714_035038 [Hevea brasiliensis]
MNLILYFFLAAALFLHIPFSTFVISINLDGYQPEERAALLQLRDSMTSSLDLHSNWTGPPCIANFSRWAGIVCSNWHVIHIVLEGIQLSGPLPPAFLYNISLLTKLSFRNNSVSGPLPNLTNLVHLESVLLSYNRFTGSIPSEYIELPNLERLEFQQNYLEGQIPPFDQKTLTDFNVSYNYFQGSIPPTETLRRFPESSYGHNLDLCGFPLEPCPVPSPAPSPPPPSPMRPGKDKKKKLEIWIVVLIAALAALVPLVVLLLCPVLLQEGAKKRNSKRTTSRHLGLQNFHFLLRLQIGGGPAGWTEKKLTHSQSTKDPERKVELEFFERNIAVFDLDDLLRASAEVLGNGKHGTTYKANLESGDVVAVKRVKNMNGLSKNEFIQQVQLLGKLKHENLVQIISFYHSKEEKLIIYEFVRNRGVGRVPLNWAARLSIIKDIAKGLAFLHRSLPSHKVPHANLKSSNVLIHQDGQSYRSKLTDYGFLPLLPSRKLSESLAISRSPEFSQRKKLTHKTDVYCFGIILLEVITGRIPGEVSPRDDEIVEDLSDWVRTVVNNDWSADILDVEILPAREGHDEMLKLTEMALQCTDVTPETRPKMSEILGRIEDIEQKN